MSHTSVPKSWRCSWRQTQPTSSGSRYSDTSRSSLLYVLWLGCFFISLCRRVLTSGPVSSGLDCKGVANKSGRRKHLRTAAWRKEDLSRCPPVPNAGDPAVRPILHKRAMIGVHMYRPVMLEWFPITMSFPIHILSKQYNYMFYLGLLVPSTSCTIYT